MIVKLIKVFLELERKANMQKNINYNKHSFKELEKFLKKIYRLRI